MCGNTPALSPCLTWLLSSKDAPANACFVLDEERLFQNAGLLDSVRQKTGAKILLALKAFANWPVFYLFSPKGGGPLAGVCASSVDEARLGKEEFGGEVHTFAAAWSVAEIKELAHWADHIVFNSLTQWRELGPIAKKERASIKDSTPLSFGLRVNPCHSENAPAIYDPCSPGSRLGIRPETLAKATKADLAGIEGLHFHALCEQGADALDRMLKAFKKNFQPWLGLSSWLNFGGGHHITKPGYDVDLLCRLLLEWKEMSSAQIYLEPGEAVALNAGWLTSTVLDIVEADKPVAILDVSAACHMPDVLEMPYTPFVWRKRADGSLEKAGAPEEKTWRCALAGKSCLAGDIIGQYSFDSPLRPGERIVFGDMAIYSMVKTTTFNGLRLPSIGVYARDGSFRLLREFGYEDFKSRLG